MATAWRTKEPERKRCRVLKPSCSLDAGPVEGEPTTARAGGFREPPPGGSFGEDAHFCPEGGADRHSSPRQSSARRSECAFGHSEELAQLVDRNGLPGTTGSPAVSPVDERLDQIGAVCFDAHVHYAPPPCAFRPHPARSSELREEIMHMVKRQEHEIERKYCSSPSFNDYLHEVQEDTVEVAHRRKVFEWNLELADHELRLSNQALLLSFNYFDQYMALMKVRKTQLQLVSTACMWVASKICASECPVAKAEQLESLIGIGKIEIVEMERWLLSALKWQVQPVTPYDMVHLLLPFLFCKREHRQKLVQYIENITLAQALVYPLLQYEPSVLAVTAIVCGAKLISGSWDEELNRGLIELVGSNVERARQCRRDVESHINLQNLVLTNDEAQAFAAERERERRKLLKRRNEHGRACSGSASSADD